MRLVLSLIVSAVILGEANGATMKAVVAHQYGAPEVLKYEDAPRPEPKENELLVRVIACGVNPADPLVVGGRFAKEFGTHLPLIPGYDVAGGVGKTGAEITKFKKGDAVYGYALFGGGWAEYAVLAENEAALKPKSATFVEAAAVPMGALTSWQSLSDTAKLSATASTANQDLLKPLGADVAIDYTKTKFEDVAKDVDVVFDTVGRDTLARSYPLVKKGGIVTTIVSRPDPAQLEKFGIRGSSVWSHPDGNELAEITKLIEAGKIKPVVGQVRPLTDAVKASQQAETHHTRGKLVLKIAEDPR